MKRVLSIFLDGAIRWTLRSDAEGLWEGIMGTHYITWIMGTHYIGLWGHITLLTNRRRTGQEPVSVPE